MTAPNLPGGALPGGSVNELGIAEHAAKPQSAWEAEINGQWQGKFQPIGSFRTFLLAALQGLVAGPLQFISDLFSLRWAQVDSHETIIVAHTEAIADLADIAPSSPVTPAYVADIQDMASVARRDIVTYVTSSDSHTHNITGSTASGGSGDTSHTHGSGTLSTASDSHTHTLTSRVATFTPDVQKDPFGTGGKVYYVPIVVDRKGVLKYLHWIVGADAGLLPIVTYEMALCAYNPTSGNIEKVWDSGNLASTLSSTTTLQEAEIDMGLSEVEGACTPGQILFIAHRQRADGLVQTPRSFAYAPSPGVARPASMLLRSASYITPSYYTGIPSSIALTALTGVNTMIPWAAVSVVSPEAP